MQVNEFFEYETTPVFLDKAKKLYPYIKRLSYDELKDLFKCSDSIAKLNYDRYQNFDFDRDLSPVMMGSNIILLELIL